MRFMQQETAICIMGFTVRILISMHTYSRAAEPGWDSLSGGGVSLTICLEI